MKNLEIKWVRFLINPTPSVKFNQRIVRDKLHSYLLTRFFVQNCIKKKDFSLEQESTKVDSHTKEKIFSLWLQGEENAPQLVKRCFENIRYYCSDYDVIILNKETLFSYVSLPEVIIKKFEDGKIKPCHFADICRVELLRKYGGIWIDATCFLTSYIPKFILETDFFMFSNPWSYMFVQNCFIRAQKGSRLITMWADIIKTYWTKYDICIDYFMHQVMFNAIIEKNLEAKSDFERMPKIDHFPLHKIWYYMADMAFSQEYIDNLNSDGYFFQKTSYKSIGTVIPGSFKDFILNGNNHMPLSIH